MQHVAARPAYVADSEEDSDEASPRDTPTLLPKQDSSISRSDNSGQLPSRSQNGTLAAQRSSGDVSGISAEAVDEGVVPFGATVVDEVPVRRGTALDDSDDDIIPVSRTFSKGGSGSRVNSGLAGAAGAAATAPIGLRQASARRPRDMSSSSSTSGGGSQFASALAPLSSGGARQSTAAAMASAAADGAADGMGAAGWVAATPAPMAAGEPLQVPLPAPVQQAMVVEKAPAESLKPLAAGTPAAGSLAAGAGMGRQAVVREGSNLAAAAPAQAQAAAVQAVAPKKKKGRGCFACFGGGSSVDE